MSTSRPILFWIATVAAVVALAVLLREVLLPFVAGMVLAYLLDPLGACPCNGRADRFFNGLAGVGSVRHGLTLLRVQA